MRLASRTAAGSFWWTAGGSTTDPIEALLRGADDPVRSEEFRTAFVALSSRANDPSRSATSFVEANVPPHLARELLEADLDRLLRNLPSPTYHWRDEQGQEHAVEIDNTLRDDDIKRCRDRLEAIVAKAEEHG